MNNQNSVFLSSSNPDLHDISNPTEILYWEEYYERILLKESIKKNKTKKNHKDQQSNTISKH